MFAKEDDVFIDGSFGEGGGQVLRTSLTLSMITGRAIHITNIRAGREKPGLRPQHLKAVDAAVAVSKAEVEGAFLGSQEIFFRPGSIRSGRYNFKIGTAGWSSLVLQTILLPLSMASSASTVSITGGTHVPWSPSYDYLNLQWLPYMKMMGLDAKLSLHQAGFYPKGGCRIQATIRPVEKLAPLSLNNRGKLKKVRGISAVANLNPNIADRQKRQAIRRLLDHNWGERQPEIQVKRLEYRSQGKGTVLLLLVEFDQGSACYCSLGEIGKPAERVADDAVDSVIAFVKTKGTVDQYLADQLILPLSLSSGFSEIHTNQITQHLITNAAIIRRFVDVKIEIMGKLGIPGYVRINSGESV